MSYTAFWRLVDSPLDDDPGFSAGQLEKRRRHKRRYDASDAARAARIRLPDGLGGRAGQDTRPRL